MSTPMGVWVFNHQWFDKHYVARSEYFNDFMIPNGHMQVAGCRLMVEDRFEVHMAFQRPPGQLAYDLPQRQILESLGGHLQRAAAISMRLAEAQRVASFVRPALDSIDIAVIVLDAECRLEYANRPAELLLRTSNTLTCQSGRLSAGSLEAQSRLEALVRNAANGAGAAALFTDAAGQSLQAVATPLSAHAHACTPWQRPLALLMLADGRPSSANPAAANPARFSQMFGLTPAEARLACGLLEGHTLVEYAHATGVNIETARTQLRAVLTKTGTRRQAEMMRLLGKLPDIGAI